MMNNFNYNPVNGLTDQSAFPDNPGSSAEARTQIQTPLNQARDFINNTIVDFFNNGGNVGGNISISNSKIVESGTTATGKWVKFYDGTMICYLSTTQTTVSINAAYGSLFQGSYNWIFPVAFISTPTVTCGAFKYGTGASWGTVADVSTTNSNLRGIDVYSRASGTATLIQAMAIGKWK